MVKRTRGRTVDGVKDRETTGWGDAWDVLSKYAGTEGPEDWSEEHDQYLYGVPKREMGHK